MKFYDYTIMLTPGLHTKEDRKLSRKQRGRVHETDNLAAGAVEIFSSLLENRGESFLTHLPVPDLEYLALQWTARDGAAIATFFANNEMSTTSILLPGKNPETDAKMIRELQKVIIQATHDTPNEPGFDLMFIQQRPALITVPWPNSNVNPDDLMLIADAETCLAAAYFESLE